MVLVLALHYMYPQTVQADGSYVEYAPGGSGDYVRVVGYVIDSNTIYS